MGTRSSSRAIGGSARPHFPRPTSSLLVLLVRDGELWVGLGVVGLGLFFLLGSLNIQVQPSYATIGPRFFPMTVGISLIACGLWTAVSRGRALLKEAGATAQTTPTPAPMQWRPFLIIVGALVAYTLLLRSTGFVVASALLFAAAAYALGHKNLLRNAIVGLALALVVYLVFTQGLGLYLPASFLERLLG